MCTHHKSQQSKCISNYLFKHYSEAMSRVTTVIRDLSQQCCLMPVQAALHVTPHVLTAQFRKKLILPTEHLTEHTTNRPLLASLLVSLHWYLHNLFFHYGELTQPNYYNTTTATICRVWESVGGEKKIQLSRKILRNNILCHNFCVSQIHFYYIKISK